ncbi:hypothetical protein [Streptomyces europaeiscabiei]|uniref:hypothetical protein n=1 Tax=Streptomyces europaeiscabiei TaxID=146819 RepID=UPI0038F7DC8C
MGLRPPRTPFQPWPNDRAGPGGTPPGTGTEEEWTKLLLTARNHHRVAAYRKRAYALLLMLYTCCLRIGSLLNARVEGFGYYKRHRVLLLKKMIYLADHVDEGRLPQR